LSLRDGQEIFDGGHTMKLFIAMPYGAVTGRLDRDDPGTQKEIQFDEVWNGLITPAIPAEWEAKRADELHRPGLIDQLYTEWLLDADVVLADLTFSNPNVFYELGIRQALSRKSTVLIAQKDSDLPFDVRNQAVIYYDYFHGPSAAKFHTDLKAGLTAAAAAPGGSPVHTFLPGLFIGRFAGGIAPDKEIADLKAEIERLRASASIEQGTAAQFERRIALRGKLTELLSKIIRAQLDNAKLGKDHANDPAYVQMVSSTLNQENAFLLNEAIMLMEQIPDLVGTVEYNTVAYSLSNAGETDRSEKYYRRAISGATSPFEGLAAQRSFAQFLFAGGRLDEGRALYQNALSRLPDGDPFAHQTNGYTLQGWGWCEAFVAREPERANRLFDLAQQEYAAIKNPMARESLLNGLAAARQGVPQHPVQQRDQTHPGEPNAPTGLGDFLKRSTS
jgi:tetratricopeptide (TPR) repeat protein